MRSGGVAWRNPPCTPGRLTRRRSAWWKKRGPTPRPIPRPWPAMDCGCGPPPRLQNSSGCGLPRDNPSVSSRPSFWPGAVTAWMAWASVPCCWCGTMLRGIRARECGNGCGRITARSNSRGVAGALSPVGCRVKARGSTLLSPSGSMGNGRWSKRTGCSVLRSWRIGFVPIMGVLMKPIFAFPKRLLDHALGRDGGTFPPLREVAWEAYSLRSRPFLFERTTGALLLQTCRVRCKCLAPKISRLRPESPQSSKRKPPVRGFFIIYYSLTSILLYALVGFLIPHCFQFSLSGIAIICAYVRDARASRLAPATTAASMTRQDRGLGPQPLQFRDPHSRALPWLIPPNPRVSARCTLVLRNYLNHR